MSRVVKPRSQVDNFMMPSSQRKLGKWKRCARKPYTGLRHAKRLNPKFTRAREVREALVGGGGVRTTGRLWPASRKGFQSKIRARTGRPRGICWRVGPKLKSVCGAAAR